MATIRFGLGRLGFLRRWSPAGSLKGVLLHEVLQFGAAAAGDQPALIFEGDEFTFSELWDRTQRAAASIIAADPVGTDLAIISENSTDMVVALYAASLAGRRTVLGNTRLALGELVDLMDDVAPTLVLGSDTQLARFEDIDHRYSLLPLQSLGSGRVAGVGDREGREGSDADTAWIIHTSGTTGRAKPVAITHRSLLSAVTNTAIARPIDDDAVYLLPFPLFHVAAYNLVHAHLRRRPVVLVAKFEAVEVMEAIQKHRVSVLSFAPTMLAMLLAHPRRSEFDLRSIETIAYGASAMSPALLRTATEELGCGFAQGYGMTELSGNAVFLGPDDHRAALTSRPELLAAAGKPGPLVQLAILDDDGSPLSTGEIGEIAVKGDQVIAEYVGRPDATADSFTATGWFLTGDIGRIDDEGYLYVVDRKKDIIITGGENVSSREVEDVLSAHADIAGVAVVGLPHDQWGEKIVAAVIRSDTTSPQISEKDLGADLITFAKAHLSGFKCPKEIRFVDELPVNASGKVLKRVLRDSLS